MAQVVVVPKIPRPQWVPSCTALFPRDCRGPITPSLSAVIWERADFLLAWSFAAGLLKGILHSFVVLLRTACAS